ncbi:MAG: ABC transporter ATP-binding protein [Pseudomonadales bacterium]
MIEADGLERRYGEFVAVDGVSFSIAAGEVVGLLGHNGAGKTTIMKMLTGYLEPSAGSARVAGIEVEAQRQQAQALLGYLPENLPLYPEMTIADYLAYVATLREVEPRRAVRRAIEATELGAKAQAPIGTLSRGFKQRVGVAQAILHEPRCLILDEPTNGLDPQQTQQMRTLIRDLSADATVILSTHIMQEVDAVCDRALILRAGKLVLDERLENLKTDSALTVRTGPNADFATALAQLPGVTNVVELATGHYQLEALAAIDSAAASIAALCQRNQIELYELAPMRRDLERVFREANEGD